MKYLKYIYTLFLTLLFMGCDSPYNMLASPVDSSMQMSNGAPFIRTENGGSTLLGYIFSEDIFQSQNPGHFTKFSITDSKIDFKTVVNIEQGSYDFIKGSIVFHLEKSYSLYYQKGSDPNTNPQTEADLSKDSPQKAFYLFPKMRERDIQIGEKRFKELKTIIDLEMESNHSDLEKAGNILLLYQVGAVFLPQCRIAGFGGIQMTQYLGKSLKTQGLSQGKMVMDVSGLLSILTQFKYTNHSDLSPITINGFYQNIANMSKDGSLAGTPTYRLEGWNKTYEGSLFYHDIKITGTIPSEGSYDISFKGIDKSFQLGYTFLNPGYLNFSNIKGIPNEK